MAKVLFVVRLPGHEVKEGHEKHPEGHVKNEEARQDLDETYSKVSNPEDTKSDVTAASHSKDSVGKKNGDDVKERNTNENNSELSTKDEPAEEEEKNPWDFGVLQDVKTVELSPETTDENLLCKDDVGSSVDKEPSTPINNLTETPPESSKQKMENDATENIDDHIKIANNCSTTSLRNHDETQPVNDKNGVKEEDSYEDKKGDFEDTIEDNNLGLVRLVSTELTLLERVKSVLERMKVSAVQWSLTEDNIHVGMFLADDGAVCEEILNRLSVLRVGLVKNSSISIFPANISITGHDQEEEENDISNNDEKEENFVERLKDFKRTMKSKLVIQQVIKNAESDAVFSFDYVMLIVLASFVALMGLLEASSVILVASMLISPLMGPILAGVLGAVIRNFDLIKLGLKSELKGLGICIGVGFIFGLIPAGLEAAELDWRATDSWPTAEMSSRGVLRSLPVGILIAVPSGAGVALSVLGGKVGSLVGVAISASLLPPAVNAGLLWANALLVVFIPPPTEERTDLVAVVINQSSNSTLYELPTGEEYSNIGIGAPNCPSLRENGHSQSYSCNMALESLMLGIISLLLTLLNILCIIIVGGSVLKLKEVAPLPAAPDVEQEFYGKTLKIARESYQTAKGVNSLHMRDQFLQEYKAFKGELGVIDEDVNDTEEELNQIMEDVGGSSEVHELLKGLPYRPKRWSSTFGTSSHSPSSPDTDQAYNYYNTVQPGGAESRRIELLRGEEMQAVRRRKHVSTVESPNSPTTDDSKNYFTIHRYVPPSQSYSSIRSPRSRQSGAFFSKLIIPKATRFQIAKVVEDEKEKKHEEEMSVMRPVAEQEKLPLMQQRGNLLV